jgi:uncharacterized protein (TIGR02246 family)
MKSISVACIVVAFLGGLAIGLTVRSGRAFASQQGDTLAADMRGIETLRRTDIDATLTQEPDALGKLWSDDGINLQTPGVPTVGLRALKEFYMKFRSEHPQFTVLKYSPDFKELQFVDGWAIEVIDANATFKMLAKGDLITVKQPLVRVLKRQSDGSWKFALVSPK